MMRRHRAGGDTNAVSVDGLASFQALIDSITDAELFQLGGESVKQFRKIHAPRKAFGKYRFGRDYQIGHPVKIDGERFELVNVTISPDTAIGDSEHGFITLYVQTAD